MIAFGRTGTASLRTAKVILKATRHGQVVRVNGSGSLRMSREVMIPRSFEGRIDARDVMACYEPHNEEVRQDIPADRRATRRPSEEIHQLGGDVAADL